MMIITYFIGIIEIIKTLINHTKQKGKYII